MEQSSRQIKLGAVISYFALAINILATMLYIPWMVSVIGRANYALYTLANSFVNIFLIDFGLSSSVSKFVSQYRAENKPEKEREFISTIAKVYVVLDFCIVGILCILFFFIGTIYKGLTAEEIATFRWLYLIVASYAVVSFPFLPLSGIMYAYEKLVALKLCEVFQKISSIVLVIIALLYQANVIYVVLANVISALLTIAIKFVIIYFATDVRIKFSFASIDMFKQVVTFTAWLAVQSLAQRCIFNLAPSILGIVATSEDIAIFAPATSIEGYFASVAAAINGFFIMRITKYLSSNKKEQLEQLMLKVGRFQVMLLGMIYVVFLCVGDDFMTAWMGTPFRGAWPCAALVMLPDILIFSEQIANTAAIANNLVKQQSIGYIMMAIVCVGFSFPLSRLYGAMGAAIAIMIAYLVLFIFNNFLYTRKMKVNMWDFIRKCYGKWILPAMFTIGLGYYICHRIISVHGWSGVFIKSFIVCFLYLLAMMVTSSKEERAAFRNVLR